MHHTFGFLNLNQYLPLPKEYKNVDHMQHINNMQYLRYLPHYKHLKYDNFLQLCNKITEIAQ